MQKIEDILKAKGIRPTAVRLLVYKFMAQESLAMSLNDIEAAFDKTERTTLFRSLKLFEEKGLVHKIEDGSGIAKYALQTSEEGNVSDKLHLHFHCSKCGETQCLTDQTIPNISLPNGFKATDANLVVKGLCDKCS
ncbi:MULTISPECIES: Fur family transcriptional regulator [unclassified Zunongwangia]|uniref:Fur family transcriptional regulator n=1 Tax=unclassified Zunongwangia TaxID=2632541 RepID=UPI0022DD2079|nr:MULTISPECIES: transcriptional repressor [unclassified Zunongwangia]WBL22785.1 transcriptional repressor [Zunongwangia sp. HRR-M8]WBL25302.1 transcriptional repressor [Zunongwangia sp. HGR-M22]